MAKKLTLSDAEVAELWKQRFFEAQASMERLLVQKFGYNAIDEWIAMNAETFQAIQAESGLGTGDLIIRLAKQAECYKSDYNIDSIDKSFSSITIYHCGIWDYRERAKQNGVKLIFDSPCIRYCTKLTSALVMSKGFSASYELIEIGSHHGCRWVIANKENTEE